MRASMPTALATTGQRPRSIDDLDAEIMTLARNVNAETYRLLVLVREFDDRLGWTKWSFPSCAEWLAWRLGLSLSAAREKVRTAHALRGLKRLSRAFADGQVSYSKVRALSRVATAQNEDLLLAYALDATAAKVEERCRQMRNVHPDSTEVARRAWERRSLTILRQAEMGTMRVTLEIPLEDGELFAKAIDRAVEVGKAKLGPEFETSGWHAEQADAAIEIARSYLGRGGSSVSTDVEGTNDADDAKGVPTRPASAADHYQVVVHVDASALAATNLHQDGAESLRGGIPGRKAAPRSDLPIETIQRLTCDGSIVRVIEDADGKPLDVGRKQRTVPLAIKRALLSRDRGCTFPGCERTHYLDAHHIHHWAKGGETSSENLILLCTQHHRLLHEGRFRIRRDIDDAICFERHDGRVIPKDGYAVREDACAVREPGAAYPFGPNASRFPDPRSSRPSHTTSAHCLRGRRPSSMPHMPFR
jgi:Domain of unknown function (DUF222)/HNH endonuclease